ncbi:MAG: hypothetical protein AAB229_05555 [Candidatus Hydrogenedentota bacterium]
MAKSVNTSGTGKSARIVKRAESRNSRVVAEILSDASIDIGLITAPKDRVAECLAAAGLVDSEIERIRGAIPVLPVDVELIGRARAFVTANASGWDHDAWTGFLAELEAVGYEVGPDRAKYLATQRFLGVILETIRATEYRILSEETFAKAA